MSSEWRGQQQTWPPSHSPSTSPTRWGPANQQSHIQRTGPSRGHTRHIARELVPGAAKVHVDSSGLQMYMWSPRGCKCTFGPCGAANVHVFLAGLQMYTWTPRGCKDTCGSPGDANVHVVFPGLQMFMWSYWGCARSAVPCGHNRGNKAGIQAAPCQATPRQKHAPQGEGRGTIQTTREGKGRTARHRGPETARHRYTKRGGTGGTPLQYGSCDTRPRTGGKKAKGTKHADDAMVLCIRDHGLHGSIIHKYSTGPRVAAGLHADAQHDQG